MGRMRIASRKVVGGRARIAIAEHIGCAICCLLCVASFTSHASALKPAAEGEDAAAAPELLTFDELAALSEQDVPPAALEQKLDALLATPFVDNSASNRGVRPLKPLVQHLGPSLRIVQWNIERGIEFPEIRAALSGDVEFEKFIDRSRYTQDSARTAEILKYAEALRAADVVILNEVDWGLKRSGYRFVTSELASPLGMNCAYGVDFVAVDPLTLGTEKFEFVDESERTELVANTEVDRERTKGLHGNAILSRYRLDNVRMVRFKAQGHDWYAEEKRATSSLEKGKRTVAAKAFLATISREIRRGGRMFMVAELADEQFPGGKMTIVNAHLEAKTQPSSRVAQLAELLAYVKNVDGTLVIGGDMNTTGSDSTPTSIGREITRRVGSSEYWAKKAVMTASGLGFVTAGLTFYRHAGDPTVKNVPLLSTNKESKFFTTLEHYRFADGGRFDFQGDRDRSVDGRGGTLSNSNQRASKGFVSTFQVERSFRPVGKLRLDWLFVKIPAGQKGVSASPLLTPFFGMTYKDLNYAPESRMSDHDPISVDLPLLTPPPAPVRQP